jgi:hypothetical protein
MYDERNNNLTRDARTCLAENVTVDSHISRNVYTQNENPPAVELGSVWPCLSMIDLNVRGTEEFSSSGSEFHIFGFCL